MYLEIISLVCGVNLLDQHKPLNQKKVGVSTKATG
jgi:hypothetical protein